MSNKMKKMLVRDTLMQQKGSIQLAQEEEKRKTRVKPHQMSVCFSNQQRPETIT